jgi:NADP-dependent aldehyde dehydrogenase
MPDGVFALLQGTGQQVGIPLVKHPAIRAVGFTGSRFGGLALAKVAAERPVPIPVFAEMSSVNPVVILKGALEERSQALAEGLAGSVTMGVGQFCTNPGLVFLPAGKAADRFTGTLAGLLDASKGGTALHQGIARAYDEAVTGRIGQPGVETVSATDNDTATGRINPWIFRTDIDTFLSRGELAAEAFGPSTTLVTYKSDDALIRAIEGLEGQLTGSIHHDDRDLPLSDALVDALQDRVGRLLMNGFPTGVEVCSAMVHGGPYPSTSDGRTTSVGTAAIERWTRRFCWQDSVQAVLPLELKDGNPLGIRRLVDGAPAKD